MDRWSRIVGWALAGVALVYAVGYAWRNAWVCDDAFISYRYCQNFVNGLGLVFNAGEQVEGYTNFLWVLLVSLGMSGGADPIVFSQVLGVGFFIGTFLLLASTARTMRTLPVAAIGLALHEHFVSFATCGLETSMFAFLVTFGLVQLAQAVRPGRFLLGGLALILATMTRPDGAIFYALASGVVVCVCWRRKTLGAFLAFAAPFVLLYAPYFLWKFSYYGYPFPNTFYAKSASDPYADQGLYYVGLYFECYYYLIPALLLPVVFGLVRLVGKRKDDAGPSLVTGQGLALLILFTLPFLGYVIWVGGDFMFARFCLPVTPALFLGLQLLARGRVLPLLLVVAVSRASFRTHYPEERLKHGNERGVVEEKKTYPDWYVETYRILGTKLKEIFAGRDVRVAVGGGQAMLGYFGEFPYVLELNGLTDANIAHREVEERGQPGHEKKLPFEHPYLREKGIDLVVGAYHFIALPHDRVGKQREFEFKVEDVPWFGRAPITGFARATLITYDDRVLKGIAARDDVKVGDFAAYLADYEKRMATIDPATVKLDLAVFDAFYFEPNGLTDSPQRNRIAARAN